jgi:hypothetical protein
VFTLAGEGKQLQVETSEDVPVPLYAYSVRPLIKAAGRRVAGERRGFAPGCAVGGEGAQANRNAYLPRASPENTGRKQRAAVITGPEPCNARKSEVYRLIPIALAPVAFATTLRWSKTRRGFRAGRSSRVSIS